MKKFLSVLFCTIFTLVTINNAVKSEPSLRSYKAIQLAQGSFLKAVSQRNISTATSKVGDVEYFINPCDVYIGETNIIPKDSLYLGEVESVLAPVEGINAAMKIKIYKVITPSRNEYALDAYVYWKGSTTIGGDLTPPMYYTKMPHYPGTWKRGALQLAPTSIRYPGQPTAIKAGDEVTFMINKDMGLYKP